MDVKEYIKEIHKDLANTTKIYIESILDTYGKYIPDYKIEQLSNIDDYRKVIFIEKLNTISAHADDRGVHLPIDAINAFGYFKTLKEYGVDKNHSLYNQDNLVINDNTFFDYLKHLVVTASRLEDYYQDSLLHEVMHFCGSGGVKALKEGINEYLTRKIAKEKGFRTSGCGYPKETKIAYELEKIFGEDILNQIAFINREEDILAFLEEKKGVKAKEFYKNLSMEMEKEFQSKYFKDMNRYGGLEGIKRKCENYDEINYSRANKLIEDYKKKMTR